MPLTGLLNNNIHLLESAGECFEEQNVYLLLELSNFFNLKKEVIRIN
jgi:hypothetical protein